MQVSNIGVGSGISRKSKGGCRTAERGKSDGIKVTVCALLMKANTVVLLAAGGVDINYPRNSYSSHQSARTMPPNRDKLITENGIVAQTLLRTEHDPNIVYDTIVIGSGMGGGVVASALADEQKNVLVLEAGSLLFPTHVGNLPRRLLIGKFQKHIWSLWYDFAVRNYNNVGNSAYNGGQGFNLGGRSIFWGSSIPPLAKWELDAWPKEIQDYLLDASEKGGYALARGVFNSDVPQLDTFHASAVTNLSNALGQGWDVGPAPVAVEYAGPTEWSVPAGIFSTADLLLEDALAVGNKDNPDWRAPLTVNLNHAVWNVNIENGRATGVRCWDLLNNQERTYRAKSVVISAGCLESAKIALASGIPNNKIGRGIVDHPIYYRHFVIPPQNLQNLNMPSTRPPRNEPTSTKLLIRHQAASLNNHAFDIILELGAQFNQGRIVDHDNIANDLAARDGYLLCELVFQFYSPLIEANSVTLGTGNPNDHAAPVNVDMQRAEVPALLNEARGIATTIFQLFGAEPVLGEQNNWPDLQLADVGGVAHEVGTLRMPIRRPDGTVEKGVLDQDLKFEGVEGLYACDNSVFPVSPAGNPSLTLVALARRLAKTIATRV
jgi:choline dehydrogenase-like flavoprotein